MGLLIFNLRAFRQCCDNYFTYFVLRLGLDFDYRVCSFVM